MDTKLKNKLLDICTTCSVVAAIIGFVCIGAYVWRWINTDLMETIQFLQRLF
ncbi:hypothetical protein [Lysinibacillus sp. LZ02]|uniref:hypothetical protein n=1 Tax=Lysinibacillus sp. LZ02 TaxID=3420668 RepID=UPI003D35CCD3